METERIRLRLKEERKVLRTQQEQLSQVFESFRQGPSESTQFALRTAFSDFAITVNKHFQYEEAGGYLTAVEKRRPHRSAAIARRLQDHQAIRDTLKILVAELARPLHSVPTDREAFCESYRSLLDQFERHMRKEQEMVMDAYWKDGGVMG